VEATGSSGLILDGLEAAAHDRTMFEDLGARNFYDLAWR
jgi:hypothetical protein